MLTATPARPSPRIVSEYRGGERQARRAVRAALVVVELHVSRLMREYGVELSLGVEQVQQPRRHRHRSPFVTQALGTSSSVWRKAAPSARSARRPCSTRAAPARARAPPRTCGRPRRAVSARARKFSASSRFSDLLRAACGGASYLPRPCAYQQASPCMFSSKSQPFARSISARRESSPCAVIVGAVKLLQAGGSALRAPRARLALSRHICLRPL